jgi:sialate O-acetylesterase
LSVVEGWFSSRTFLSIPFLVFSMRRIPELLALVLVSVLGFALEGPRAVADVRLPGFFGDHMVFQQGMPLKVWGWSAAEAPVQVSLGNRVASTNADASGRWEVEFPAMRASKDPLVLEVTAGNTLRIEDVLIGEVWLCSGQSNMEWTVRSSTNSAAEIAAGDHPMIRHMKVDHRPSMVPLDDIESQWQVCTPEVVGNFTACGYFMARELQKRLDVPIGLINSSWGGTRVEPWTPPIGFKRVDALSDIYESVMGRTPGTEAYRTRLGEHIEQTESWLESAKQALDSGEAVVASPPFPEGLRPFTSHQQPTMLYNGMIHALVGFPIRGAIWYQGEANHREGMLYFEKKKALIGGWRELWGQGDFPFYYVQIAPFQYGDEDPEILARFWEAQAAVQRIPKTAMVVVNDIATIDDIHPPNKQDVGKRLALLALKHDYGYDDLVAHSPELESFELLDQGLKVRFKNTGGGLKTRDGGAPNHFELIGPGSRGYKPAEAVIEGDAVILSSADVARPVAFRYAWRKTAEPNLTGATGLPVGAFRGGEEPDFLSVATVEEDFQLVYDLDLGNLGKEFQYDVDRSSEVGAFDRIGYLLELDSEQGGEQKVFVAMDAFTDDAGKIGVPTVASGASFQQPVQSMEVFSNVSGLTKGLRIQSGNIEFWPNNYGPGNGANVPGASSGVFDFGDDPGPPVDGYGSMQVHNGAAKETVFAVNHWGAGSNADIGIGNSSGPHPDWTFSGNAARYSSKRLRVYVRPVEK